MEPAEIMNTTNIIVECRDSAPDDWDAFVQAHPDSKTYHLSRWNTMIEEVFGHQTVYFVLRHEGELCGVLPLVRFSSLLFGRFATSLPFINYGGPLLKDPAALPLLEEALGSFLTANDLKFIELRMEDQIETALACKAHKVTFLLDLPDDADTLMNSFKAKLRSQIRRPEKEGMTAKSGGEELLEDFYRVFTINMRDLGTPPLPKHFFRTILRTFPEDAFIGCVYSLEGTVCAASFLIRYGELMEIPWASSLREFNKFSPNMLLYWESLRLSIEKGCKRFDYGRCSPDVGTYRFKKQWGAEEKPLYWYYALPKGEELPEMNPGNSKFDLMIKVWQKLPVAVTRMLGPHIIKHIP